MEENTLFSEISAIQIKLLFLHFKSVKINDNIRRINSVSFPEINSPDAIKTRGETAYDIIEIIALFESYNSLISDIYKYQNISKHLNFDLKTKLNKIKKATAKWKFVRNKIGGHLDIGPIQEFCDFNNYKGVFISNQLEADFKGVLILQMIESAINLTLNKSKLFQSELKLTDFSDLIKLIKKVNEDWSPCINLFSDFSKFLYTIGKKDKLKTITKEDIGIIKFDKSLS